ncbi:DUF1214 domain-containing protein [Mesorhizobium sp. M6A.T.Ce.TU.016.01.1.1]|uniref:DUF1214 domain-containing protein n=1 Tax=Mesorhizobium sp. M6A.T.Ce.TU.016.01.1.1 TaxID=2496783 RepID=UPI000FCC8DBD|nr:DUF1214 domain-containing protein [Mesorhizobium sp. M6A.T.Ce.TU.016.01.1.1]RUU28321.1 DUF1254 domain-containing protein [Mesorhizobium sp. M6A.T.Ce.TU.016.01.1.1]
MKEAISDQAISDAYIYLLGRLLVTRQQQLDFKQGFKWNELVHRKPGEVDWPNPNLDVAYSEAWVAADENSCTMVSVPKIEGRYYTVHFLNGWGETIANINERLFPKRPFGEFAICFRGTNVEVPAGATRIDLPVKYSRVLARVELGSDPDTAIALQHQFKFRATGTPKLPEIPKTPLFELEAALGVEAFEAADIALDSEPDLSVGLEVLGQNARAIAKAVKDPAERVRIDHVIRTRALADFGKAGAIIGHGTMGNGWARPGVVGEYGLDYLARALINHGGIWANIKPEVLYYRGSVDQAGAELSGDNVYTLTFPKDGLPAQYATFFWSVIAVDSQRFRVLPNPLNKFLINNQSGVKCGQDGSLTLYFADQKPADAPDSNWLPTPKGQKYRLTFRFYRPTEGVANGTYHLPPVIKR